MPRYYSVYCFTLAIIFASTARADVAYTAGKDGGVTVVRMTVTPAAAPVPALRYRLVARDIDLKSGNAAPYYYRAQLGLGDTMKSIREKFDEDKELGPWYGTGDDAMPIAKLPLDKIRTAKTMFDPIVEQHLKPAFERSDCDWQWGLEELRGPDVLGFLLPEVQGSRDIARMLALRTRLAIAEHRYDDAVETIRQQYRLGRDVAEVPLLVCGLVGIAIDGVANGTLVDFIANPDSPNMYWALSQLPQPPVDLRRAARFEMDFGPRLFPFMQSAETTDHSPQEWNRLLTQAFRDFRQASENSHANESNVVDGVAATGLGLMGYTHAKERLIAQGMDREKVEKMAVGQVIAIYTERNYRRFADDWETLWYLPFPEVNKAGDALKRRLDAANVFGGGDDREVLPIVSLLLPAIEAARGAQVRLERDVAALRTIESLRMYAANHDGKLPGRLEDIHQVPVPANPATGKPFMYRLEGATAILELPSSDRLSGGNCRYEIQVAAKK